jgi:hypothetical protein
MIAKPVDGLVVYVVKYRPRQAEKRVQIPPSPQVSKWPRKRSFGVIGFCAGSLMEY